MKTTNMTSLSKIVITILFIGSLLTSCSKEEGCTDPAANNFNIEAETDDGSCTYTAATVENTKTSLTINFTHNFDGLPFGASNFNQFNYITANNDTLSANKLRYLISDVTLYKANGDSTVLDGYQLIDLSDLSTLSYAPGEADFGSYTAIGFTFGFDSLDNTGNYIDLNSANWNWPDMIGGGYHFMQFDGKFMNNGADQPFNYHNGTASNSGIHEANHFEVRLSGISLNEKYASIEIKMNVAEWFKNPYTWDLNTYNTMLMPNYTAQKLIQAQGYSVFSLGMISQKKYITLNKEEFIYGSFS